MKKHIKLFTLILSISLFQISCSPLKILSSWSEEGKITNIQSKNILVITKTKDRSVRIESETQMQKQLRVENINAVASFVKFGSMTPNKKMNKEGVNEVIKIIKSEGFNVIVLTTLKDYKETEHTSQTGGYYAGGMYYNPYYARFGSYYGNVYSNYGYYDQGVYVPQETQTTVSKDYILETVTYDLDLPKGKELISVVSVKIEDPSNLKKITKKYAKKVVHELLNK